MVYALVGVINVKMATIATIATIGKFGVGISVFAKGQLRKRKRV